MTSLKVTVRLETIPIDELDKETVAVVMVETTVVRVMVLESME